MTDGAAVANGLLMRPDGDRDVPGPQCADGERAKGPGPFTPSATLSD
jgi:hypothetical protein